MRFQQWSGWHLAILLLTVAGSVLLPLVARRDKRGAWKYFIGYILAAIQAVNYALYVLYCVQRDSWDVRYDLPMELCNWSAAVTVLALVTRRRFFAELSYFWVMAGSVQGVITPDLNAGFPQPEFFFFFLAHSGLIIASSYAVFGLGLTPQSGAVWRVILASELYLVSAFLVDLALGANYGYLMAKPRSGSLLDYLGDWPYYILSIHGMGLVLFLLLYLPFRTRSS